jgi:ribosomal protein L7/L12
MGESIQDAAAWPENKEERRNVIQIESKLNEYKTLRLLFADDDTDQPIVIRFTVNKNQAIPMIKEIRRAFGLGLAESKAIHDARVYRTNNTSNAAKFLNSCKPFIDFVVENGPSSLMVLYGKKETI